MQRMLLKKHPPFYGGNTERKDKNMTSVKKTHESLKNAVQQVVANKEKYVKNPQVDFTRNRKLPMGEVINHLLSMTGGSLKKELYAFSKIKGKPLTPSAFVQQRSKISSAAFKDILYQFNDSFKNSKTYYGYRLLAVDGSDVNCPRNPESEYFLVNDHIPKGYNQIHLNALYDICNKVYLDIELLPRKKCAERKALISMLHRQNFTEKTLFITDRGYESYNMFAHFLEMPNVDFLCRVKHGRGAMVEIAKLPMQELDRDIAVEVTTTQTKEDKLRGRRFIQTGRKNGKANSPKTVISQWDFPSPYTLKLRVVRFLLDSGEYETLVTSLDRDSFSLEQLKELYHMRWDIETSFRDLKYSIGLTHLHSKKDELIRQEIYAAVIMYNYCSRISSSIAMQKRQKCKYAYKVNFAMAIHICKAFYRSVKKDFESLICDISHYAEPVRPGRKDDRNLRAKRFAGFLYRVAA